MEGIPFRLPLTVDGRPAGTLSGRLRAEVHVEPNLERDYLHGLFHLTDVLHGRHTHREKAHTEGRYDKSLRQRILRNQSTTLLNHRHIAAGGEGWRGGVGFALLGRERGALGLRGKEKTFTAPKPKEVKV